MFSHSYETQERKIVRSMAVRSELFCVHCTSVLSSRTFSELVRERGTFEIVMKHTYNVTILVTFVKA